MNSVDMLRQARSTGYGAGPKQEGIGGGSRSFPLIEDEDVPDGPCCLKVYGTAQDGKFVIDRIDPDEGTQSQLSPS